jgi:OmpA-OmpF porin, OOP family
MRGLRIALGLVGVFGLTATAAAAEDAGFFVGGGVGQYNLKIDVGVPGVQNFEDSAAVWRVFGGYQLNKYLGLEADYVWYSTTQDHLSQTSSQEVTFNGDAAEAAVRLSFPLGAHFEPFARVGWNWYNVDGKVEGIKGQSNSDDAALYSGGIALILTPALKVSAEYEVIDIDNGDLNAATISFVYKIPR